MNDRLAIELIEDEAIPGRVFFQLLSGMEYGQFTIQTLGSFCLCRGRFLLQHKWIRARKIYVPFQCNLDCAENVTVKDVTGTETAQFVPSYLKVKKVFHIKATNFPAVFAVDALNVDLALASYKERKDIIHHQRKEKFVFLFRTSVKWKKYEQIALPPGYSSSFYQLNEVVFDKMTLFSGSVVLPKIETLKSLRQSNDEQSDTPASSLFATPSESQSLVEKLMFILLERSITMDIFLFFITLIVWLILFGERASLSQTLIFLVLMMILIANSRSVIAFFFRYSYGHVNKRANSNGKSFYVNGWNAWSFCGSVRQGEDAPVYSMPSVFVKAFHHGGVGTALPINLGEGEIPISASYFTKHGKSFYNGRMSQPVFTARELKLNKDFIASDMFTLLADLQSHYGLVAGFLSQKQHYGCLSTNLTYDRLSVHISGDGVLIPSGSSFTTDIFSLYAISSLENPFSVYVNMVSEEHQVRSKLSEDIILKFSMDFTEDYRNFQKKKSNSATSRTEAANIVPPKGGTSVDSLLVKEMANLPTIVEQEEEELFPSFQEKLTESQKDLLFDPLLDASTRVSRVPVGWCSWYHFFRNINEENLSQNIQLMKDYRYQYHLDHFKHGFHLFQVDDGYQRAWGDWTEVTAAFSPSLSLASIVEKIDQAGLLSGIWMAPFACDKHSRVAKEHPEWILRKRTIGNESTSWLRLLLSGIFYPLVYLCSSWPCNSGNCGKFFYGLDITHPSYQRYLQECIEVMIKIWGFKYLKLDFLYSAVLQDAQNSYYDRTLTRAQIMQLGMRIITDALQPKKNPYLSDRKKMKNDSASETEAEGEEGEGEDEDDENSLEEGKYFLLGCGSVLGSIIGHVHANRISPDAGLSWDTEIPFCRKDKWNLPSARTMIQNTINRMFLHNKWWINDPDCLLLRDELPFTEDEILGIISVKALSGGSILLSDDLSKISPQRFRRLQQILPPTNISAVAVDQMDKGMPECFRILFISNHYKRHLKQLRRRRKRGEKTSTDLSSDDLLSPFESLLYSKNHPSTPYATAAASSTLYTSSFQRNEISAAVAGPSSTLFESLDFAEERVIAPGNSFDDDDVFGNDSFEDCLHEDHATLPLVEEEQQIRIEKIAKGTAITPAMRCQGIKEKWLDKRDLLKRWVLFTVCNWSDDNNSNSEEEETSRPSPIATTTNNSNRKTHFLSLKEIFTEEVLTEYREYTSFLYDPVRKIQKEVLFQLSPSPPRERSKIHPPTSAHNDESGSKRSLSSRQLLSSLPSAFAASHRHLGMSPSASFMSGGLSESSSQAAAISAKEIQHLLHFFNFWTESYSYRVVDLMREEGDKEEEAQEIAFPEEVPGHSAHIYAIHLSLHPLLPQYLGSNLHFSCGLEVRHCFLTETLPASQRRLQQISEDYLAARFALEKEREEQQQNSLLSTPRTVRRGIAASKSGSFRFSFDARSSSSGGSASTTPRVAAARGGGGSAASTARFSPLMKSAAKTALYPSLSTSFSGAVTSASFSPVIQTICLVFEEGVLKEEQWNGFVWVYLPVNIKRAKIFYQLLGKVEVRGTAWGGASSTGNEEEEEEEERLKVVEYIEEPSCRAAGYVYRLKVSSAQFHLQERAQEKQRLQTALEEAARQTSYAQRRTSTRSSYISATSTIDEADEEPAESQRPSSTGRLEDIAAVVSVEEEGDSLSMSATLDNIDMSRPLRRKFDHNEPGIVLPSSSSASASFLINHRQQTLRRTYSSPSKPLQLLPAINQFSQPQQELPQSEQSAPKKEVDYLLISWISDMEENVDQIDSVNDLFA